MKLLTTLITLTFLTSCGSYDPNNPNTQEQQEQVKQVDEVVEQTTQPYVPNLIKGLCSYNKDRDKGCMKTVISSSELYIGDFYYSFGAKEFSRKFASELAESYYVDLEAGETLELTKRISYTNFYSSWGVVLEGSHTTYRVYHSGLGNLRVDDMAPGYYNALLMKEFDLKVLDEDSQIVGYKCAVVFARHPIEVEAGIETATQQALSEFELEIFDESCSGSKKVKDPELDQDSYEDQEQDS